MKNLFWGLIDWAGVHHIMGFGEGLAACHALLTPGDLLAVTELSWLRPNPPADCRQYFADEYPVMADIDTNLASIKNCGYRVVGHFTLPESAWWESYYNPLESRLQRLHGKYATDPQRIQTIDSVRIKIEMYRRYASYYGYVFYLMQRS